MTNAQPKSSREEMLMAIEVSEGEWRLAFTDLKSNRQVAVPAWNQAGLAREVVKAREHFGLGELARVRSCYEAGRCGFSLHRYLESVGIGNTVVDPGSIEVRRGRKHQKTDRLDAKKLAVMLTRYLIHGETDHWRTCRVPTPEQEAARRLDREHERLKKERTGHVNRIRALLSLHGISVSGLRRLKAEHLRDWSGKVLDVAWQAEIGRELARLRLVEAHIKEVEDQMLRQVESPVSAADRDASALYDLRGIGPIGAVSLATQFFSWRDFRNVKEVGAAAGLVDSPYNSGTSQVSQGISKCGSRRIRTLAVELAWIWLRLQPASALSQWFTRRFASGGKRLRRIGIVALARKLMVALWKYLRQGIVPEGAVFKRDARHGSGGAAGGVAAGTKRGAKKVRAKKVAVKKAGVTKLRVAA